MPSGIVTSATNAAASHGMIFVGVGVIVGDEVGNSVGVVVGVGVGVGSKKSLKVESRVALLLDVRLSISVRVKVRGDCLTSKFEEISYSCLSWVNCTDRPGREYAIVPSKFPM